MVESTAKGTSLKKLKKLYKICIIIIRFIFFVTCCQWFSIVNVRDPVPLEHLT